MGKISFMGSMLNIVFKCNLRETWSHSLSAAHISCITHDGWGNLPRRELQAWLSLFPKCSMTGHDTACYTTPSESYRGGHPTWKHAVLHSSLDGDSGWQGLLTLLAFCVLNICVLGLTSQHRTVERGQASSGALKGVGV